MYAQSTVSLATALNPYIGYAKAAEIVKESVATGESIIKIARAKNLLSEEEISEILDPVSMTEPQYPRESAKERGPARQGLKSSARQKGRALKERGPLSVMERLIGARSGNSDRA